MCSAVVTIDNNWLESNRNAKSDQPLATHAMEYSGKPIGSLRILQAVQKTTKLAVQTLQGAVGRSWVKLEAFSKNVGTGIAALNIPRLPHVTYETVRSIAALREHDGKSGGLWRRVVKAAMQTFGAVAAYGYFAAFATGNPVAMVAAQAADLTSDIASLHLSADDYNRSTELEAVAQGDVKEVLTHSRKYHYLSVIKDVIGIVTAVAGIAIMAVGYPFIPAVILTIVAVVGVIIAVIKDLHKEMGRYKVVEFEQAVQLASTAS